MHKQYINMDGLNIHPLHASYVYASETKEGQEVVKNYGLSKTQTAFLTGTYDKMKGTTDQQRMRDKDYQGIAYRAGYNFRQGNAQCTCEFHSTPTDRELWESKRQILQHQP